MLLEQRRAQHLEHLMGEDSKKALRVAGAEHPSPGPPRNSPTSATTPPATASSAAVTDVQRLAALEDAGVPLLHCTPDGKCGDCRTSSDCPPGKGCVYIRANQAMACVAGECKTADDCAEGQRCVIANDTRSGPPIRLCIEAGAQPEGAECFDERQPDTSCALGLVCVLGRCGRGCEPNAKQPCGARATCVRTFESAGCYPSCASDGDCASGQVCKPYGSQRLCVVQVGPDCSALQCSLPSRCEVAFGPGKIAYECVTYCNPLSREAQCADGFLCGASGARSRCYQRCTSGALNDCPAGRSCAPVMEDGSQLGCVSSVQIVFPKALRKH